MVGRQRFSSVPIFLFTLGVAMASFLILFSVAVTNDSFGYVHSPTTQTEKEIRPLPVGSASKLEYVNRGNETQRSTGQSVSASRKRRNQSSPISIAKAALHVVPEVSSPQLPGARGRRNFRNVVVPNLSFRDIGRKFGWMAKPHGDGVKPQTIVPATRIFPNEEEEAGDHPSPDYVLKAYVEPIDFKEWEQKPLPVRSTATEDQLEVISFPKLNSCTKLPEMIPADEYPDHDPFLPWIHDVFPTDDGRYIQFVAQNRRRCHTGRSDTEKEILHLTQPNVALFQHVPVKRIKSNRNNETRYRLSSHEEADPDAIATRFICRFKPSMEETLSVFNFDYDYASHRKRTKNTFQYRDGGILSVHLSQFIFQCPVPQGLVEAVKTGSSVENDWATLFVDLIPIRTPPRYGLSNAFLQPRYSDRLPTEMKDRFDPIKEWGSNHVIPRIKDSGRWENIPICKTTLRAYYPEEQEKAEQQIGDAADDASHSQGETRLNGQRKKHGLVACIWASAGYSTRGNRFAVNDGQRRLLEWVHFNKLIGFDHFYLYDNSYAFSNTSTLKPIADLFPNEITYIKWPFQVCNNNPNNVDSPGERSSQYAAESSCRLRFGPHAEWIGQFDIDEYLVPMGNYTSMLPIIDKLNAEGKKILSFKSWRAWPRRDLLSEAVPINDPRLCMNQFACFDLQVPPNTTILQTYNCERQAGPKQEAMPAEKQLYRPDYVLQHFIHYSSVTMLSQMNRSEFERAGYDWFKTKIKPDPLSRFSDELEETTMLHAKAVARQDTAGWLSACKVGSSKKSKCRIGVPFPENYSEAKHGARDDHGWLYNCYVNEKIEHHWAPLLAKTINEQSRVFGRG